ncbi:hypothetical protein P4C99_01115 [Pontiellaceae bacterium B1224]|nr:hypothetical protein [Pontiellaceae bacterium B1224]
MSGAAATGASTAAIAATIANAIKACGTLIRVEPQEFLKIVGKQDQPLVVIKSPGAFSHSTKYLTSYKGLAFHCKSQTELMIPSNTEVIHAKKFSMPDI